MSQKKPGNFNVPNSLTAIRMLLIPLFCWFIINDKMMEALAVFAAASLTDLADGYIARKFNMITDIGKLFDPLADKLMIVAVMFALSLKGIIPWYAIGILLINESMMLLGGLLLLRRKTVVASRPIGKAAQFVIVIALIMSFFHKQLWGFGCPIHLWLLWLGIVLKYVSLHCYMKLNGSKIFTTRNT